MKCPFKLREGLDPLPSRILKLPIDERGYPVPFFVKWEKGEPEFRAMDIDKWIRAVNFKLCWVCGERLGRYMTFVAGPMCGISRTTAEPPGHHECARWSVRNCPFLNNPDAIRRTDEKFGMEIKSIGGVGIPRNPGVELLWTTSTYTVFDDRKGGKLINMGEPSRVEWMYKGREATRAEVEESVRTGLPSLEMVAQMQEGGLAHLEKCKERFAAFLPA